jgi:predicted nucleic acid-binding protein
MSRIFFDTNLFIYLFEDDGARAAKVSALLEAMARRKDELLTSTLTLGELLVKPVAAGNAELAAKYEATLSGPGVHLIDLDAKAARLFAQARALGNVKPPDAIQLACAAAHGCDMFLTNDDRLSQVVLPGIQFVASFDRAPIV